MGNSPFSELNSWIHLQVSSVSGNQGETGMASGVIHHSVGFVLAVDEGSTFRRNTKGGLPKGVSSKTIIMLRTPRIGSRALALLVIKNELLCI